MTTFELGSGFEVDGASGRARPPSPTYRSGFTLLELLIAMVVAAFILLVISGTYFGALRLHNSTQAKIDNDLVMERTLGLVNGDLVGLRLPAGANATPPTGTFSGQFQDTPTDSPTQEFSAERISPDFYTTSGEVNGWNPFSEVQVVTYFLAPATDGSNTKSLVRAVTRNLLPVSTPTTDEQTLVTGVANAEFDYYDGSQWDTTWDSTQTSTVPYAVRFSLTMAGSAPGKTADPIELVMPVLVSTKTSQTQTVQAANGGGT
jgi:prepilin-type N-terminal cleavage/methylation domain-containing protein